MTEYATRFRTKSGHAWALLPTEIYHGNGWCTVCLVKLDSDNVSRFKPTGGPRYWEKRTYNTGWNGERLAVTKDLATMKEKDPDLHDQLIDYLRKHVPKRTD